MLFRTQIIFCSSELRLHFRIAEVGSLLSLNRAWRAQVTSRSPFSSENQLARSVFLVLATPLVFSVILACLRARSRQCNWFMCCIIVLIII